MGLGPQWSGRITRPECARPVRVSDERRLVAPVEARPRVQAFLRARVGQEQLAEDLASEVYVVAWRHLHDVPSDGERALGWLFGVARHVIRNQVRGDARRRRLVERAALHAEIDAGASHQGEPGSADRRIAAEEAWSAISAPDRQLLGWTAAGLDQDEIAEALGVGVGAVRMRLLRARARLHEALDDVPA